MERISHCKAPYCLMFVEMFTQNNTDLFVDNSVEKGIPVVYGNYMATNLSNTFVVIYCCLFTCTLIL